METLVSGGGLQDLEPLSADSRSFRRLADLCLKTCSSPEEASSLEELFRRAGVSEELTKARNAAGALERFRRRKKRKEALRRCLGEATSEELVSALLCPITMTRPRDPVLLSDGHVYERGAIDTWLERSRSSPMTREALLDRPYVSWNRVELAQARLFPPRRPSGRASLRADVTEVQ